MLELEVKIFEIDKDLLISKIEKLWAKKVFDSEIFADFYVNNEWKKNQTQEILNKERINI